MLSYEEIAQRVKGLSTEVGTFIRSEAKSFSRDKIETKGINDFVSYVDLEAEKMIVEGLRKILPIAGFVTEEGTDNIAKEEYNWIIDPLDGTTNFMHGLPPYSISIALSKAGSIVVGVVYVVSSDEMFHATAGGGSWLNGNQIYVSEVEKLTGTLVGTGFPYKDYDLLSSYLRTLQYFITNTQGVRRQGSAAVDLAYVACGRLDCFFEFNLNAWDVSAGILLIREAGGQVSDFDGSESNLDGKEIAAANKLVFNEFREAVFNNIR